MGLFGGDSSSTDESVRAQTSKNAGFSDVSGSQLSSNQADISGRDVGSVRITTTDQGAVQGGLELAGRALDFGNRALMFGGDRSDRAIDAVQGFAEKRDQTDSERFAKLGALTLVALVGLNAWQKRGRA